MAGYRLTDRGFVVAVVTGSGNLAVSIEVETGATSDDALADVIERAADLLVAQPWTSVTG